MPPKTSVASFKTAGAHQRRPAPHRVEKRIGRLVVFLMLEQPAPALVSGGPQIGPAELP